MSLLDLQMNQDPAASTPAFRTSPTAPPPGRPQSRWLEAIGPALLAITLIYLILWTWRRTLDPVIDFGRELYTPWQLAQGRHLYTDIAAFYGPLSQYFNALAMRLFGPTLLTLIAVNIAILAAATALLYAILRTLSTPLAATAACLMFLIMFATAHIGAVGNFNFITPYSHEATHGFVLSLAALFAFLRFAKTTRRRWAFAIGLSTGLAFLTKPEIFIALAGALAVGLTLLRVRSSRFSVPRRRTGVSKLNHSSELSIKLLPTLAIILAAALLPPFAMTLFLTTHLPLAQALHGTLGAWTFLSNRALTQNAFYANSMGLQAPANQLFLIAATAARFAALLLPALLTALLLTRPNRSRRLAGICIGILSALLVAWLEGPQWWSSASEILLLSTLILATVQIVALLKNRRDPKLRPPAILRLTLITFALLMLLKMFLHTRFHQYGFVLAVMPTMLLALALLDWFPAFLESKNKTGWTLRAAALTVLAILTSVSLIITSTNLAQHNLPIGDPPNSFLTDERAPIFNDMIHFIQQNSRPDQTLTVLPEGIMLNVLTHRRNPIPYTSVIPSDLAMFGEDNVLAALAKSPPDFIAILYRPTAEFGKERFGNDYALDIRNWTMHNYHPAHLAGTIPFTADEFGILLLRRNDLPTIPTP